jgi:hypothetical protein
MEFALAFAALLVLVVALLFIRRRKQQKQQAENVPAKPVKPYAAVRIRPIKHHSCDAAYEASYKIFLVREAPILPLRDCNQPGQCRCSYVHYDDRRHGSRRSDNIKTHDLHIEGYPTDRERRQGKRGGRRKTD